MTDTTNTPTPEMDAFEREMIGGVLTYEIKSGGGIFGNTIGADGSGEFAVVIEGSPDVAAQWARDYLRKLEASGVRLGRILFVSGHETYSGCPIQMVAPAARTATEKNMAEQALAAACRAVEGDVEAAFPSNWIDPILTGPESVFGGKPGGTWGCPEVERLLHAVKARVRASLRSKAEGFERFRKVAAALLAERDELVEVLKMFHEGRCGRDFKVECKACNLLDRIESRKGFSTVPK